MRHHGHMRTLLVAVVLLAAACSGGDKASAEDPYDVYLRNAPSSEKVLSREDAQARAILGCKDTWAPGTVDAVLADAYREVIRDNPMCK